MQPRFAQDDLRRFCSGFSEGRAKRLELDDMDAGSFGSLLAAWCGRAGLETKELGDLMALAGPADRFEMTEVQGGLEDTIIGKLSVETCANVVMWSGGLGLRRVEAAAERMVVELFEEVAASSGRNRGWCGGWRGARQRGRKLLGTIRFGLMEEGYLGTGAVEAFTAENSDWVEVFVSDTLRARLVNKAGRQIVTKHLGMEGMTRHAGQRVAWERYKGGGGRRLTGHTDRVRNLVECRRRVCSGSIINCAKPPFPGRPSSRCPRREGAGPPYSGSGLS